MIVTKSAISQYVPRTAQANGCGAIRRSLVVDAHFAAPLPAGTVSKTTPSQRQRYS
jgi:hypothetical protein